MKTAVPRRQDVAASAKRENPRTAPSRDVWVRSVPIFLLAANVGCDRSILTVTSSLASHIGTASPVWCCSTLWHWISRRSPGVYVPDRPPTNALMFCRSSTRP